MAENIKRYELLGCPVDGVDMRGALDYVASSAPRRAILLHFEKRLAELHGLYSPAESPHHALQRHFQHMPAGRAELLEQLP